MRHWSRMCLLLLVSSPAGFSQSPTEPWRLHVAAAQDLQRQGSIPRAEAEFRVAASEAQQSDTTAGYAHVLDATGEFYDDIGKFAEAQSCLEKSLAIWRGLLGPEHFAIARVVNRLAAVYLETGQWRKAEHLDLELWIRRVEQKEPASQDLLQLIEHLAELDSLRGELSESHRLYRQVIDLTTSSGNAGSAERAVALNNLGLSCLSARDYDNAIRFLGAALQIWEALRGPEDSNTALTGHALAVAYQATGRTEEAEPLLKRALSIAERSFGPDSLRTAAILQTYARLLRQQNRKSEAAKMEARARRSLQTSGSLSWNQVVDITDLQSSRHH
jgi:tetratricopeptide (TPR) repeat protein